MSAAASEKMRILCVDLRCFTCSAERFQVLDRQFMLFFGCFCRFACFGFLEEVSVRTISPEDITSRPASDRCVERVEQVDECKREIHERVHAESRALPCAACRPREHRRPECAGVLECSGHHVAGKTHFIELICIQRRRDRDTEELVAHRCVAEDPCQHGSGDELSGCVELMLDAAEESVNDACTFECAAVADSKDNEVDRPQRTFHAACFAKDVIYIRAGCFHTAESVVEQVTDSPERDPIRPDELSLEDDRCDDRHSHCEQDARKCRHLHHADHDDHDERDEYERVHIERLPDGIDDLGGLGVIVPCGIRPESEDRIQDERDQQRRTCGRNHRADVIKQPRVGYACSKVGGVGQRREFVAYIRAGNDHTCRQGRIETEAEADAHERNADCRRCGPGRSAGQTCDRAQDAAYRQEYFRREQFQSVEDQGRDSARCHERCDKEPYRQQDENRFQRVADSGDDRREDVLESAAVCNTYRDCHAHGDYERHVCIDVISFDGQIINHEGGHTKDWQDCGPKSRKPYLSLLFLLFHVIPLSAKYNSINFSVFHTGGSSSHSPVQYPRT